MPLRRLALALVFLGATAHVASGIVIIDDNDNTHDVDTTTPGDNSGWQYEGQFAGYIGTPIAPFYFMTAQHIGGGVGQFFFFHDEMFTTTAVYNDPATDLRIWQVDHAFAVYAPLYQANGGGEKYQELRVYGRGAQRGTAIYLDGTLRGWAKDYTGYRPRWGRNIVSDILPLTDGNPWTFLVATFDSPGLVHEAHLTDGDSSGGVFILEDGLWRLAAINYGVDELFTASNGSGGFTAPIFDARGYYEQNGDGTYFLVTGDMNQPTSFYSTQISTRMDWIKTVIDKTLVLPTDPPATDPAVLPPEKYATWLHAYYNQTDVSNTQVTGPNADPDGDGIPNLLEFAFNLDPTFTEAVVMTAGTGLRGLPLIRVEQVSDTDRRLTVEFVRRTAGSGSGVTYAVQFATNPGSAANWQTGGTESVTAINARWERVKVTDTVSTGGAAPVRFARVAVTQ